MKCGIKIISSQESLRGLHQRSGGCGEQGASGHSDGASLYVHFDLDQAANADLLVSRSQRTRSQGRSTVNNEVSGIGQIGDSCTFQQL